jgi:hypothetical protein
MPSFGQLGCSGFVVLDGKGGCASRKTLPFLQHGEAAFAALEALLGPRLGNLDRGIGTWRGWVVPDRRGHVPRYEQQHFSAEEKRGRLRLVASPEGEEGSVRIRQDVKIYAGLLDGEERATFDVTPGRAAWVHVARGAVVLNGQRLVAGDAAAVAVPWSGVITSGRYSPSNKSMASCLAPSVKLLM